MRTKRKKNGTERLLACGGLVVSDPAEFQNGCETIFGRRAPLSLEIGCGKGDFILGMAEKNPDKDFIAIERIGDVLVTAAEKLLAGGITNVRVCCMDALRLAEVFPEGAFSRIYLNFSDPWPKKGHYKRRLTYAGFLKMYERLLTDGGSLHLKTDNDGLFAFSLEQFENEGWKIENMTYDLHGGAFTDNVMTEYEKRFSALGVKIKRLEAYKPSVNTNREVNV